ncbi:hypothetical protein [Streptomyces pini]|uniref:Uncharacterized protein n=1 Tax=Streptomyces pini TaxID=1520580 RepID=A0A1I4C1C3_9ACTN|nr:hypothetical protein [Streptomyces pini]SFK73951.1 hypothetical protein SAMN05192584_108192 [Streptomyces pini]
MKNRHRPGTTRVPYSINGITHMVEVEAPKMPRDLDHTIRNIVTAVCALMLAAAVVWSTVKIGGLLDRRAPEWAAYTAAGVFDIAWIICMALEWDARHDPKRARRPMIAGWVFLALAMAAIITDGHLSDDLAVGIISAAASAVVKGVWWMVLTQHATPLDPLTQQWYDAERARMQAQRGLADVETELLRTQHKIAMTRAAYGLPAAGQQRPVPQLAPVPAAHEAQHDAAPGAELIPTGHTVPPPPAAPPAAAHSAAPAAAVEDPVQLSRIIDAELVGATSKAEMVRRVRHVAPDWNSTQIADALTRRGVQITAGYVRSVDGRPKPKRPVVERPEPRLIEQPPLADPEPGTGGYA